MILCLVNIKIHSYPALVMHLEITLLTGPHASIVKALLLPTPSYWSNPGHDKTWNSGRNVNVYTLIMSKVQLQVWILLGCTAHSNRAVLPELNSSERFYE